MYASNLGLNGSTTRASDMGFLSDEEGGLEICADAVQPNPGPSDDFFHWKRLYHAWYCGTPRLIAVPSTQQTAGNMHLPLVKSLHFTRPMQRRPGDGPTTDRHGLATL